MTNLPVSSPNYYSTQLLDTLVPVAPSIAQQMPSTTAAGNVPSDLSLLVGRTEFAPLWGQSLIAPQIAAAQNLKHAGSLIVEIDLYDYINYANPMNLMAAPTFEGSIDVPSNLVDARGNDLYGLSGNLITLRATSRSIGASLLPSVLRSFKTFVESGALQTSPEALLLGKKSNPLSLRASTNLAKIYALWADGEYSDEIVGDVLSDHFARFLDAPHFVDFISSEHDVEFLIIAIRCFAEVGREHNDPQFRDALLELTASPIISVRYSAISCLGLQLDQRVKSVLSIRLSSEQNKTIAALLSASVK